MKKKNTTFKKATCSAYVVEKDTPKSIKSRKNKTRKNNTCYTKDSLILLKEAWNSRHPDKQIINKKETQIWRELREKMNNVCDIESCWYKQVLSNTNPKRKMMDKLFAPSKPSLIRQDPNNVISSIDIDIVMRQYEEIYPHFKFIGPSPLDYDTHLMNGECVWKELCEFDFKYYVENNIDIIGIIFNLDNHNESGSHWVAMIIDLLRNQICFFCSYGSEPEEQHMKLVKEIKSQAKEYDGRKLKFIYNKLEYQGNTNECGIYCMYLIIQMLKGKSFYGVIGKNTKKPGFNDNAMNKLRLTYFYNDD